MTKATESSINKGLNRIVVDPSIRFGKAIIKGTRVGVDEVLGLLATGKTKEEVAEEFDILPEDVLSALEYGSKSVASERGSI